MIWITADWHLGHDKEFVWKARGFSSVEEMNEAIIARHNECVRPDDDVYVLGDLVLGPAANIDMIARFNGKLHLVRGNHDTNFRWNAYGFLPNVIEEQNAIYLDYKKYHFFLSHFPSLTGNIEKEALRQMTLNIYGHTHQKDNFLENRFYCYHCGVDSHDCKPALLDEIIEEMQQKFQEENKKDVLDYVIEEVSSLNGNYKIQYCDKCVWYLIECGGPTDFQVYQCPVGHKYKRDPPDGGYYG